MATRGRAATPLTSRKSSAWQKTAEDGRNPKGLNPVSLLRTHLPIASVFCRPLPPSSVFSRQCQIGAQWMAERPSFSAEPKVSSIFRRVACFTFLSIRPVGPLGRIPTCRAVRSRRV